MKSESFGEFIRRLRIEKNLSLRIVAAEIDIDQSTLSKIERNEKQAPEYIVEPLARLFDQDVRSLEVKYLSEKVYYDVKNKASSIEALEDAIKRLKFEGTGTLINDKREALFSKIREYLKTTPIEKAWIFGSFARNAEKYDSDIDLLVRFEKNHNLDLFEYIGITHELEDLLGRKVDVVEEGKLQPKISKKVKSEKKLVYAR